MKFTCDSCGSAYMIPDDKVGPAGVKVRCKKCGNVVTVRRPEAAPAPAPEPAPPPPAEQPQGGLDDELGAAFDHAFGGAPALAPAPEAAAPAAPSAAPAAPTEWFVGIGDAQVGPMPVAEVKRRWESSELGPDSLVWCAGMADWTPLSSVAELAAAVSPPPRPAPEPAPVALPSLPDYDAPAAPVAPVAAAPALTRAAPAPLEPRLPAPVAPAPAPAPAAAPEVEWKPAGASALASLASEEMAAREAAAAPVAPRATAGRSLIDQLPDSGGVDPTGVLPLPIKGMEATEERPVRKSSVARGSEAMRQKRSSRTALLAGAGAALVVVAAAAAWMLLGRAPPPAPPPAPAPVVAAAPVTPPPAAPAPAATPAAETAAAASTPAAAPTPAANPAVVDPPLPSGERVAVAAPAAAAAPVKPKDPPKPPPTKVAAKEPARAPAPKAAAQAEPPPPAPKAAAKKKDSVLDFDQGAEDDLAAALGGTKKNVYVPPKAGAGNPPAPERLSDAQITESVRLHVEALRRCAAEQQAREPGAKGTLKMAWTIQPDGSPKDVRCLTPELAQGPFAGCISGVVRGIRFPRIGDARGQQVTFPFGF